MRLLMAERFREAVTLFEFALEDCPNDPTATNNLGCCLLPLHPQEGLRHLQRAHELCFEPRAVNLHNRAMCHLLLGQPRVALALITEAWDTMVDESAVLWTGDRDHLRLACVESSRRALAELAGAAASDVDDSSSQRWRGIVEELGGRSDRRPD